MTATSTSARAGALSPAQMEDVLVRAPGYRAPSEAPAVAHAAEAQRLWGGRVTPMMTNAETSGRFAGAALTCPPTACTGALSLAAGARSKAWRNPAAIENLLCLAGRLELRFGAELEHSLALGLFDMVSVPAGVRHQIANPDDGEARALVVLSIGSGGNYDAIFDTQDGGPPSAAHTALGVRFDSQRGVPVDAQALARRVSRFAALVPYKKALGDSGIPPEATASLSAGSVFPLIVPEGHPGRSAAAPIYGNPGLYMAIGECQSGDDGPPPHAHLDTQESFFPLDGTFELYTGFDKESSVTLGPLDLLTLSRPLMRTFRNTSGKPARILAIIQGPDKMRDRVAYPRRVGVELERRFGAEVVAAYNQLGMTFDGEDRL